MSESRPICVWGDSIAKGVYYDEARGRYAILRESCLRLMESELGIPVRNYAVMGRTAPECLAAVDPRDRVPGGIAVIEFGGNDCDMDWAAVARQPDRDHPARSSVAEFKRALQGMAAFVRAGGMEPILVTPLPIDGQKYFQWVSRGLDQEAILKYLGGDPQMMYRWQEQYAGAVRDVAREEDTRLLDCRGAFLSDREFPSFYCPDGIHPNARGHRKLFEFIRGKIRTEQEEEKDRPC